MTKRDHVQILLDALLSQGSETPSIRVDQVKGLESAVRDVRECVDLLSTLAGAVEHSGDTRTVVMAIPIAVTTEISLAAPTGMEFDYDPTDAPTVYLYPGEDFLIDADEEYRKVVSTGSHLHALFRSWRDALEAEHGWEFNNYVLLWYSPRSSKV